eukprot:TRINITY_DN37491_c0_g1_i1.p2 TRINITY_DN37491_c0_g1~~TRINITY_DN37491_c0_g1_i1.p2  ORF type:complete len:168 (+),score=15.81 TRINITY_DN37491_c0_g1_i1:250-753(+)
MSWYHGRHLPMVSTMFRDVVSHCDFQWGVLPEKMVVMGGKQTADTFTDSIQAWDPKHRVWDNYLSTRRHSQSFLPRKLSGASCVSWGHKIWIFGGFDGGRVSDCHVYDIETDAWSTLPALELCIARSVTGVIGGVAYVCGGFTKIAGEATSGGRQTCPLGGRWVAWR